MSPIVRSYDEKGFSSIAKISADVIRPEPLTVTSSPFASEVQSFDEKGEVDHNITPSPGARFLSSPTLLDVKHAIVRKSRLIASNAFVQRILGQQNLPPSKDGRHITLDASRTSSLIDERTGRHYIDNSVRTSRYTLLTFIPRQLVFQFSKVANLYFLVAGIIQLIPGLSTTGTYTTILPLVFFLLFTIAREGYDDFRRYRLDRVENRRLARVLQGFRASDVPELSFANALEVLKAKLSHFLDNRCRQAASKLVSMVPGKRNPTIPVAQSFPWAIVKWVDLRVGDVIELKRDDQVPADIVLLYVDGRDGIAYVETMALDGETNLKNRHALRPLGCNNLDDVSRCRAQFVVEDPNPDLYDFHGKVCLDGATMPLTLSNVALRGCVVRNTASIIGMVINTGEECKIRMNANKNPEAKAPNIQKTTNRIVILLALYVIFLAIGCTIGYVIWRRTFESHAWYLAGGTIRLIDIFVAFAIMFNNLIPLALYVSLELIKLAQFLLLQDVEMYHEASNTPMVSNTQNIYENLGQVNYILSDKTGTLTENVMELKKMTIGGEIWLHNESEEILERRSAGFDEGQELKSKPNCEVIFTAHSSNAKDETRTPEMAIEQSRPIPLLSVSPHHKSHEDEGRGGIAQYLRRNPSGNLAGKLRFFILSLAICHTCFPEPQANGEVELQAASPDELALVEAAQDLGWLLIERNTHTIVLRIAGVRQTYEILNIIEFSSKRKRMSIVVRMPTNEVCLFCKGADSVLLSRLKSDFKAAETASIVEHRRLERLSVEVEEALVRKSIETESRRSFQRPRPSLNMLRPSLPVRNNSSEFSGRRSMSIIEPKSTARDASPSQLFGTPRSPSIPRRSMGNFSNRLEVPIGRGSSLQRDRTLGMTNEASILESCLEHIDAFASDGLRTLVYGYRFLNQEDYNAWAKLYQDATTSLSNRQELIESAAEEIERELDLAGATGIEDKLQEGVPETIEKLQQANIKIWMLTGDKRETAITIAHSAKICKTYSEVIILNESEIDFQMTDALLKLDEGRIAHAVVVIDGQTLGEVEANEALNSTFYSLLLRVDSVICTRASPSQKAAMVKRIRHLDKKAITLAIGDGGNDIAMIQSAHVGIGISGREGLQAARVADYSIAQFRFLQRLLLVHGHWLYVRTAKFVLLTFWKEMLFYTVQLLYNRWSGYTGTSLFESWSLAVWNTLFTSLPVMITGIFEQDLTAETLLAVPELYAYGQLSRGFNMRKYWWWMLMSVTEALVIYFMIYGIYGLGDTTGDQGLFATGDLAFSVCVVFINVKLLILDYHYKTWIPLFSAALTIGGWWAWNFFLSAAYSESVNLYNVRGAFIHHFDITWWAVLVIVVMMCVVIELCVNALRMRWWPDDVQIWQEREKLKKNIDVNRTEPETEEVV